MVFSIQARWCLSWLPLARERREALREDASAQSCISGGYNARKHKEEIMTIYLCIIFSIWSTWIPELLNQEVEFLAF